jgi:hypothetical protein
MEINLSPPDSRTDKRPPDSVYNLRMPIKFHGLQNGILAALRRSRRQGLIANNERILPGPKRRYTCAKKSAANLEWNCLKISARWSERLDALWPTLLVLLALGHDG